MLYQLIIYVLIMPGLLAASPLRDKWSSLFGGSAPFFHLLPLMFVPSLILAAPIAFSLEGLIARQVAGRWLRLPVAAGGGVCYALLSVATGYVATLGSESAGDGVGMAVSGALLAVLPSSALGVFGFWLPAIASGMYATFVERPKWWVAALVGTGTLIVGVWLWILLGNLVGAETD